MWGRTCPEQAASLSVRTRTAHLRIVGLESEDTVDLRTIDSHGCNLSLSFNSVIVTPKEISIADAILFLGNLHWGPGGVAVGTATQNRVVPQLPSDGAGGAISAWCDAPNSA